MVESFGGRSGCVAILGGVPSRQDFWPPMISHSACVSWEVSTRQQALAGEQSGEVWVSRWSRVALGSGNSYIIYTLNLGSEIAVSDREREHGGSKGAQQASKGGQARGSSKGARGSTGEHRGSREKGRRSIWPKRALAREQSGEA